MDIQTNNRIEFEWDEENGYDFHKRDTEDYSISVEEIEINFETGPQVRDSMGVSPLDTTRGLDRTAEIRTISGIGIEEAEVLYERGFKTVEDLHGVSVDRLCSIPMISRALASRIKADVKERKRFIKESDIEDAIDEEMIDAEELIDELEDDVYSETDEVKFLEQETLMYGME